MSDRPELVPRRMLDLCKDTLRRCLQLRLQAEERIRDLETELQRLRRSERQR